MIFLRRTRHVASIVTLILAVGSCALAQSRPQLVPQGANQPTDDQNVRRDAALEAIAIELRAIREQATRLEQEQARQNSRPGAPIYSNWVLIVVTGFAVGAAYLTLGAIRKQVAANADAAGAAKASADTVMLAERAYVAIAASPLGLHAGGIGKAHRVVLEIRNYGRTPAAAVGGMLCLVKNLDQSIPFPDPPHRLPVPMAGTERQLPGAFLVASKTYKPLAKFALDADALATIELGRIWLVGYIDYVDEFHRRHRGGYARRIGKIRPNTNNLLFDHASARHNYDIEIDEQGQPK